MKKRSAILSSFVLSIFSISAVHAEENVGEKIGDAGNTVKRKTKKGVNKVQEEVCEMVNGKMECIGKKIKNRVEESSEAAKDKAQAIKNKVD